MKVYKEYEVYCNGRHVRYVGTSTHPETIMAKTREVAQKKAVARCHHLELVGKITIREV